MLKLGRSITEPAETAAYAKSIQQIILQGLPWPAKLRHLQPQLRDLFSALVQENFLGITFQQEAWLPYAASLPGRSLQFLPDDE